MAAGAASGGAAGAKAGGGAAGGGWYGALGADGQRAFWAAFVGVALAAFDLFSFTYVLGAIRDDLGLDANQVGILASASLIAAAVGGVLAGALADRIGRVRTIQLTIVAYAVAALLSGLSQTYWQLLLCRVLLGVGYGGDWSASSLLVAEYAGPQTRGRALGALSGAAPVGNILAALAAAALAATAGGLVEGVLQERLGSAIDVFRIQTGIGQNAGDRTETARDAVFGSRVTFGKQLNERTFIGVDAGLCELNPWGNSGGDQSALAAFRNRLGLKVDHRLAHGFSVSAGYEPSAKEKQCQEAGGQLAIQPPRQFGLDLFRTWSF